MENNRLIEITKTKKILHITNALIDGSYFDDVSAKNLQITNANLNGIVIDGAQMVGAFFHNIGLPLKGHPLYDPDITQCSLKFEDCLLTGSTINNCNLNGVSITDCNLSGVSISDCNLNGMTINGILVEDMLNSFTKGE